MARATWKGHFVVGEVSCAVELHPATTDDRTVFHMINRQTGNRLRRQMIDEATGEVVPEDDIGRGYEISDGVHVLVEDEDIEAIRPPSDKSIVVDRFVPTAAVDPIYLDTPYHVVPADRIGLDAFVTLRVAMMEEKVSAIASIVMGGRERHLEIRPHADALVATRLRYPYEMRKAPDFEAGSLPLPDKKVVRAARRLMALRTKRFRPERFEDRYEQALVALIRERWRAKAFETPSKGKTVRIGSLLEALKESLAREEASGRNPKA